ncbi:hypothetical protein EB118_26235, partial [bacterium]|nr:hypothetical protein [bacterium]NDD86042.1 hypothetical protein [bacterium]NDG33541.1 hypothetical protein [bacterium]
EQAKADLEGVQEAIDEMKREGKLPTALSANLAKPGAKTLEQTAIETNKPPFNAPRPVTVADLQAVMGLNKSQAKAVMAVYKAMGLPLPMIRLAKGVERAEVDLKQLAFHASRQPFAPEPGFPFGRFRLDKIGTGLGRQAYGWGIYLAAKRFRASDYVSNLRKTSPDAVLYDLDVPNKLVAQLLNDEKPLSRKLQVAVNRELKAAGIELTVDSAMSLRNIMDKIQQSAIWGSDANAPRLTSELLNRAGIPGLQRFVKDKMGLHMYVIWNQAALDRIALLEANGKKLQRLAQDSQTTLNEIQGSIDFLNKTDSERLNGALAIIRGFSAANVTTPIHEGAHFYRRFMLNTENGFTTQEIKAA